MHQERVFNICIQPDPALHAAFKSIEGQPLKGKRIIVTALPNLEQVPSCHILFLNGLDRQHWAQLKPHLSNASVLTVSDNADLAREGVAIMLRSEGSRLVFDIDTHAAQRAQLTFSSQLLHLAKTVR